MPAHRKINDAVEKEIVLKYQEGKSYNSLAKEYSISAMTVRKYVHRNGVESRADDFARYFKTQEQIDKLTELWKSGMTQEELKNYFGCGWSAIKTGLKKAGINSKCYRMERIRLSPDIQKQIESYWLNGFSAHTIGTNLSFDRKTICEWLEKQGYDVEPRYLAGINHGSYKDGKTHDSHGYILILMDKSDPYFPFMANKSGYCYEHRLVMAKHLGRPLSSQETVHHINRVVNDNRIENLQLRQGKHGSGIVLCCGECGSSNIIPVPIAEK